MKYIIVILLLILTPIGVFAQDGTSILDEYLNTYQYQKALDYIDKQEASVELQIKKALCYKALGEYYKAIEILVPLSDEYEKDIQIKLNLAACFESIGRSQSGLEYYDKLIRLDSTNVYFKNQKADILYQQGKYQDALSLFQHVYSLNNSPSALKRAAQCFDKMNMVDSAKVYFMEAWDRNAQDAFAAANVINLSLKTGSILEAMTCSDRYIKIDSTDHQVNLLNALSYYTADNYEEAVSRFTKCYLAGDSSLVVTRSLGISHYSLNESSKAIPYLESAYRNDTTNNNVLYCLALSYKDMSEYELAIPLLQKLLDRTIPPNLTLYLYYRNLAESYNSWSDAKNANINYEKALDFADEDQKMNVYYLLANLNEYRIRDRKKAFYYYQLYKDSLIAYIERLKKKDRDESEEIARSTQILKDLEKFIKELEASRER